MGRKQSALERRFEIMWRELGGPALVEEHQFHPVRKWRFDFAHMESKTAIELEGGVWGQSRHTKPVGYIRDCEKYNAATALGWSVFRIPGYWLTLDKLTEIKNAICQKNTPNTPPPN
jgi:very-short-patch-repair endonuclease|tara:strand:- start:82 stop:432 length:351 start_codon:yes stop_codon:yes gene_type:complete